MNSHIIIQETIDRIQPVCFEIMRLAQHRLDQKTKPRKSLGRLEDVAVQLCGIQNTTSPAIGKKSIVVMAADHGVAQEGVSAYPQEVTRQMLLNFASGGAAINVLARLADAQLVVVDMGVAEPVSVPGVRSARVAAGTQNIRYGPAMTPQQAFTAIATGIELANELANSGVDIIGLGEMGIGNTTVSSAMTAILTGVVPSEVTGKGTGIDDQARLHKVAVIQDAITRNQPDKNKPMEVLAQLGGFEIAGLVGVALGAASRRLVVVVDGFITSVAALIAIRMATACRDYLITSHRSVEPGHQQILSELGHTPLFDLNLRLGEGSGAAVAMPLLSAAEAILRDMASFRTAKVSDTGQ